MTDMIDNQTSDPSLPNEPPQVASVSLSPQKSRLNLVVWIGVGLVIFLTFIPIPFVYQEQVLCQPCDPSISRSQCPECPQQGEIGWKPSLAKTIWGKFSKSDQEGELVPATTPASSPAEISVSSADEPVQKLDPIANWKTYSNTKWGYSVKYPADQLVSCKYDQVEDGIKLWVAPFDCPDAHDIFYEVSVLGYSPDMLTRYKNPVTSEQIFLNGKEATKNIYKYENEDGPLQALGGSIEILIPISNGVIQLIVFSDNIAKVESFHQILSTFKFLDQDNVSNLCTTDADCGVNICDCKADLNQNIPVAKKACARYCPGAPRCINNRCQLVTENN